MDGHFIQIFLRLVLKFLEIIDFQYAFGFAQIMWWELFRMERHATGREKQKKRQKQTHGLMFQEGKDLHKRWNDKESGGGRQQDAK